MRNALRGLTTLGVVILAVSLLGPNTVIQQATASHQPADKVAFAASSLEIIDCTGNPDVALAGCTTTDGATIMSASLKLSHPSDLLISVSLECALWTRTKTTGNTSSTAEAKVVVWVELDGFPVTSGLPVQITPTPNLEQFAPGKVVFCDRQQKLTLSNFDDTDATVDLFIRTRAAHAFNWISIDPLSNPAITNPIAVTVKATLAVAVSATGVSVSGAAAGIGRRTLIVEPVKLKNDATF